MQERAHGATDTVQRVRDALSGRGLTLHQVSTRSALAFGRKSLFYVPHNLYHTLQQRAFKPNIHQVLALSHVSGYRLADWLAIFGFELDSIFRLQLLVPRRGTTLLDSVTYDLQAWIPWFAEQMGLNPLAPVIPLTQLLHRAAPRRAADFLGGKERKFVYARIGECDVHARPTFVPGTIVRADTTRVGELMSRSRTEPGAQVLLIEHDRGWSCSRTVLLDGNRILLQCPQHPAAERELHLARDGRILGIVDAELRPSRTENAAAIAFPQRSRSPEHLSGRLRLRYGLRDARMRSGLSFREASGMSRLIAKTLSDPQYFTAPGTLSDYEAGDNPPRQIQKILAICILYCIPFYSLLRTYGLPLDCAGRDPMADSLVQRGVLEHANQWLRQDTEGVQEPKGFLTDVMQEWEELPLFLRFCIDHLTGIRKASISDLFWVRAGQMTADPVLKNGALVAVNRRSRTPGRSEGHYFGERPLYVVLRRDGRYECGRYSSDGETLILHSGGPKAELKVLKNRVDAEVVGQVTAVVRRFV